MSLERGSVGKKAKHGTEKNISSEREKINITLVNVDELAEEAARDAAERGLTASKESMKGFGGFFKKIWKHGMAREYYRQKQLARMREAIAENEDIYAAEQDPRIEKNAHHAAMSAVVDRFASEYEETIHTGESKEKISGDTTEGKGQQEKVKGLIREYASGNLDEEAFGEARKRLLMEVGNTREDSKKTSLYADNLLEVAKQVKMAVAHGKSIDDLDFEITLGKAKNTIRTEANYSAVDKILEKVKNTKIGVLVNEATLATGVSIAYSLATALSKRAVSSRAASLLTFGGSALIAGTFTGLAENKRLKEDRRQHAREMAQGRTYEKGESPRREEMDRYVHDMAEARQLAGSLRSKLYETGLDGKQEIRKLSEGEQTEVVAYLADIEARIALSDRESIDLISYSSTTTIEQERLDLDIARAQAKVDLRNLFKENPSADGKKLEELLTLATDARTQELLTSEGGIEDRNALFNKMKAKKVAGAAIKGAVLGLAIGGTIQEATAFADTSKIGFVEHLVKGDRVHTEGSIHETPAEWVRSLFGNQLPPGDAPSHLQTLATNSHFKLPEGMSLVQSAHGVQLVEGDHVLADGLALTKDGVLDADSVQELTDKGLVVSSVVEQTTHVVTGTATPEEFMSKHPNLGTHVSRDLWFDNDTPKPVFDKNELRLQWGGEHNIGIQKDGSYQFTVNNMTANGSYHDGLSVKAGELVQEGKMRMLFSVSEGTQTHPIEVPINPDGTVSIDPNSETGKLLFKTVDGKPVFMGRFAEVAEVTGTNADHTEHVRVLATYEGKGLDTIPTEKTVTVPEKITTIQSPKDYTVELPSFIPLFGRKPLEPVNGVRGPAPLIGLASQYYLYNSSATAEQRKEYDHLMSAKLRENPDATLDAKEEGKKYLESLDTDYRAQVMELSKQAGPMTPETTLSICIPVAGHQEAENIGKTLSCYLNQTGEPKTYEIVLFVNQPDKDKEGKPIVSDGTLEKIDAFIKANPNLPVRVMQSVLPREEARIGNIRKLLNDATLARSIERDGSGEVILVSNDADTRGVAPTYIENLQTKFRDNPNTEAYFGQLDWDPESYIRNPLVHIGARLYQYIALQERRANRGTESSGANFAFKSSIYSAIGGYSATTGLGEDNDLGRRIVHSRARSKEHKAIDFAGARVSRVYTSSRRAEKAVQDGRSFIEQWDNGFSAFDDEVRKVKWEETGEAPDYNNPEVVQKLVSQLETTINRTLNVAGGWWSGNRFSPMARRSLGLLGIKYKVVAPYKIQITDASRLIAGLKEYKEDGMEIMKRKITKEGTRRNRPRRGAEARKRGRKAPEAEKAP